MITLAVYVDTEAGEGSVSLQCDDEEAMRVAKVLGFPWTPNCRVVVNIDAGGLTGEFSNEKLLSRGGDPCQLPLVDYEV